MPEAQFDVREGKVDQIEADVSYLQRNWLYRVEHSPDGEENPAEESARFPENATP